MTIQSNKQPLAFLPHSADYEKSIISLLVDPTKLNQEKVGVFDSLTESDFYQERHQIIFAACLKLYREKKPLDIVTVAEETEGKFNGSYSYIAEIGDWLPATSIEHYSGVLRNYSKVREAINILNKRVKDLQTLPSVDGVIELLDGIKKEITDIGTNGKMSDLNIVNASTWLETEAPEADQIFENLFDRGDKVAVFGSAKLRKSFLFQQMFLCLAAGRDFLSLRTVKPRKVLLVQFEIKGHHEHRRIKRISRALAITPEDIADRLWIINARGLGISGPEGIDRIMKKALEIGPDVIGIDPFYKVSMGAENKAEDQKIILDAFDVMAEQTGATVAYVHHDAKGSPGDRDIRDRGAGSNILGRDYDAGITLTAHAQDPDSVVIDFLLRNYTPREPFTITWSVEENGCYCFEERPDLLPEKKTSRTKQAQPELSLYLSFAEAILADNEMEIAPFKTEFKARTSLSDKRIKDFIIWATSEPENDPYIIMRDYRSRGLNKKWLKMGRRLNNEK